MSHAAQGADLTDSLAKSRRVLVLGAPGSGKTTTARRLAAHLDLPLHHLDDYYWRCGWRRSDETTFAKAQRQLMEKDAWIIDGLYFRTLDLRLERADTIVLINMPTLVSISGFLIRALYRRAGRPDSLPRRIRSDRRRWRKWCSAWKVDLRVWRTLLSFRHSILPDLERAIAAHARQRAISVLRLESRRQRDRFLEQWSP